MMLLFFVAPLLAHVALRKQRQEAEQEGEDDDE
jgi:hypothetical protein